MKAIKHISPFLILSCLVCGLSLPGQVSQAGDTEAIAPDAARLQAVSNALQAATMVLLTNELAPALSQSAMYQPGSAAKSPLGQAQLDSGCAACPTSAVAWWAAEGDTSDVLGAHNGIPQNGVAYVQGMVGQAFNFTGSSSVQIPYSADLISPSWSIEAWVYSPGPIDSQRNLVGQSYGRAMILRPGFSGPKPALAVSTDAYNWQVLEGDELEPGWFHVVGVYDAATGTLSLYLNGTLDRQATLAITPWDSLCDWSIGGVISGVCNYTGQFFSGGLDEVTLYNSALSIGDVQALYDAGSAGKCLPLSTPDGWRQYYWGSGFRTNPDAALNADPSGDGLSNFQKYILRTNPRQAALPDNGTINLQVYTVFK